MDGAPAPLHTVGVKLSATGRIYLETRNRRAEAALRAFEFLGPDAAASVPDLERIATSSVYPRPRNRALTALKYVGPNGVLALGRVVMSGDPGSSAQALEIINGMGTSAGPALALLAHALGSNFSSNPEGYHRFLLDALDKSARYSNAVVRRRALRSLVAYRESFPYDLLAATDPAIRADVTNALRDSGRDWTYPYLHAGPAVQSYSSNRRLLPGDMAPTGPNP